MGAKIARTQRRNDGLAREGTQWRPLLSVFLAVAKATATGERCQSIADDLGAATCVDVENGGLLGFRLTGTMANPLRYNGLGFDDNIAGGETPGALNVCMLAAFGNGGVVRANCVPTTGTSADEWNGNPEMHYFGMVGFDCGFNYVAFSAGDTITWNYPTGNTCSSDGDLDVGLSGLVCYFAADCELVPTTTTSMTATSTSLTASSTSLTTSSTSLTASSTSLTTSLTASSTSLTTSSTSLTASSTSLTQSSTSLTASSTSLTTSSTSLTASSISLTESSTSLTASSTSLTMSSTSLTASSTSLTESSTSLTASSNSLTVTFTSLTSLTSTSTSLAATSTLLTTASTSFTTTDSVYVASTTHAKSATTLGRPVATTAISTGSATLETTATTVASLEMMPSQSTTLTEGNGSSRACVDIPQIPSSASMDCVGTQSGSFCSVTCLEGYEMKGSKTLLCKDGFWQVRGECTLEGTAVTSGTAAQVLLSVTLGNEVFLGDGLEWAQQNQESIHLAFAKSLDMHPAEIRVDLLSPGVYGRRLLAQLVFDVRLTWLLEVRNVSLEELEWTADAQSLSFGQALRDELNTTSLLVSMEALSAEVIANYLQPEPFWVRGSWDTAACDAQCSGNATNAAIAQVADVTCSRGFWLLCSGAGPRPSSTKPCGQCAAENATLASILITAVVVGACSCGTCGLCIACCFFRRSMSRATQMFKTAEQAKSKVSTGGGSDIESCVL